jgi:hypothetical protein
MQSRSWMAALALAVAMGILPAVACAGDDQVAAQRVQISVVVAGLSTQGCDVEIKPKHGGCQFRPVRTHIASEGMAVVLLKDVKNYSADREGAFEIAIQEPGQAKRTFTRGGRLAPPGSVSSLTWYFNSPSKIARAEQTSERR